MMGYFLNFFSTNNIFFTFHGYQMSYLEFVGTLLNIWSVWLVTKNNILTWPVGNIAVMLFAVLFYQIQLYSDLVEQIYFLVTGFYGWWAWLYFRKKGLNNKKVLLITYSSQLSNIIYVIIIAVGSASMGYIMGHIHLYMPALFPEKASFPFLDAFTTVMSFAAQILMAHKKIECWYLWIAVDIIGIGLYFAKGVIFVSLLYLIFLILATKGLLNWKKFINPIPAKQTL
jgi:nicotinamide mononucleotide transporter